MSDDEGDQTSERQPQGSGASAPMIFLEFFFRQFGFPGMPGGRAWDHVRSSPDTPMRGQGSGFIVSSDGVILTNAHVVAWRQGSDGQAQRPSRSSGPKCWEPTPRPDVAVLKIDAAGCPRSSWARPANCVGDWVLAIGSALRL